MNVSDMDRLPRPYPGELWYSLIARSLRDWAGLHHRARLDLLLGPLPSVVNIAYPNRISRLMAFAHIGSTQTPTEFALEHTLLPYYLAFDEPDALAAVIDRSGRDDMPLGSLLGHFRPPHLPDRLKYCRACRDSDSVEHGEAYWHTNHQLPYVINCYRHGERLFNSFVPYRPGRFDYSTAHLSRCPDHDLAATGPSMSHALANAVGQISMRAARDGWNDRHLDAGGYVSMLQACGFGTAKGQIASQEVDSALDAFLRTHGRELRDPHRRFWACLLYRRRHGRVWPIQHVLMRIFLRERLWQVSSARPAPTQHLERRLVGVAA